jgi:hypothetical protein
LRQVLRLVMTPLKLSLIWKSSAINLSHLISSHNKQHRERTWLDVLEMIAGLGHSPRRAFSLKRNFVTHIDNRTLISDIPPYTSITAKIFTETSSLFRPIHPVTWLRASSPRNRGSILGMGKRIFISFKLSRPAMGPTEPPVRWVSWAPSPGVRWLRQEADHSLLLVLKLMSEWMNEAVPPLPHIHPWRAHGPHTILWNIESTVITFNFPGWFYGFVRIQYSM